MPSTDPRLTVAVTGPTGTFGFGLIPLLEAEPRIRKIAGIARRPFDPAAQGWKKMEYRRGDVRDQDVLRQAFEGAEVVVHLAFNLTGTGSARTIREINVDGTLNAFRAARDVGAKRFVYASSVAAYGFHRDNPVGMTEDWPVRPADQLFYAQEKAELERLLMEECRRAPGPDLYLLRPPFVLGPHAVGAKEALSSPISRAGVRAIEAARQLPVPVPVPAPDVQVQFIHEEDVGQALLKCVLGEGPPGAYNIAGEGILSGTDIVRELGFQPVPIPGRVVHGAARAAASLTGPSFVPPALEWIEAVSHPAIMDTAKAQAELGWRPKYTGLEALRETISSARSG